MSHEFRHQDEEEYLPEEEKKRVSRLSTSPERRDESAEPAQDKMLHQRLRIVDHLLSTAPMLGPGVDFANRVIKMLREQEQKYNRAAATGLALGLTLVTIMLLILIVTGIFGVINILLNWAEVYQTLLLVIGQLIDLINGFRDVLYRIFVDQPYIPIIALLSIPMFFAWVRMMRYLAPAEEEA